MGRSEKVNFKWFTENQNQNRNWNQILLCFTALCECMSVWVCVGVEYAATAIRHASARGKFVDLVCGIWGIWFGLKSQVSSAESRVPSPESLLSQARTQRKTKQWAAAAAVAVTWYGAAIRATRRVIYRFIRAHTDTHTQAQSTPTYGVLWKELS